MAAKRSWSGYVFFLLIFAICCFRRAGDWPIADEVAFIKPLRQWVELGPQKSGLWHSPLYPWLIMLLGKLFGLKAVVARSIGIACLLLTAVLIDRTAKILSPKMPLLQRQILFGICLLSPVTLGASLLLDYDTTLLVASTAIFLHLLAAHAKPQENHLTRTTVLLGTSLSLCLLSKETTPLVYPLALFLTWLTPLGFWRSLRASVLCGCLGVLIAFAGIRLWCSYYQIPWTAVFEMDLLGLQVHGGEKQPWLNKLWTMISPLVWLGTPLVPAWIYLLAKRGRKANGVVLGITATVGVVLLTYTFLIAQRTYHFPKYMAPVLPWLPLLVILLEGTLPLRKVQLLLLAFTVLWFLLLPDSLEVLHERNARSMLLYLAITGIPWIMILAARQPGGQTAVLITLAFSLSYVKQAVFKQHSITYWYGEDAIGQTFALASDWKLKFPNGTVYTPLSDLAWRLNELKVQELSKEVLIERSQELCDQKTPLLIVTRTREIASLATAPELAPLRKCLTQVSSEGDITYGIHEIGAPHHEF